MKNQRPLKIGISCYPTYGGSGVIATEIGMGMARRGHKVHFICYEVPGRLNRFSENIFFHEVVIRDYPLFEYPNYDLALASKMVEVCTYEKLDLLHVHYAVPHATSAYLAKQGLGEIAPKSITTLHGTDITLVGNERSYLPITRFSILQSDGVTAPSLFLRQATYDKLNIPTSVQIEVIPNFVDTERFKPKQANSPCALERCFGSSAGRPTLTHVSNFRPVKRILDVIKVFAEVNKKIPAHLVLAGDGPERSRAEELVRELGIAPDVCFLGKQELIEDILQASSVFLLPSQNESFGLAALEALSCGVPVVGSRAEGIPELIKHGDVGFLSDVGDASDMAQNTIRLLSDRNLYTSMSQAARNLALSKFNIDKIITDYERYYFEVLSK